MRVEMHWIGIGHRISQESQKTHIGNVAATYRKQDEQVNCIATISNENHTCTFIVYNFFFCLVFPNDSRHDMDTAEMKEPIIL